MTTDKHITKKYISDKYIAGKFIVIEGIDGAGTTTQTKLLGSYLFDREKKYVPLLTREPTMLSPAGQELRRRLENRLLPEEKPTDDPRYWAELFVSDRRWHVQEVVLPNLQRGLYVISDRHMLSTLAYQSAQGMPMDDLLRMHERLLAPDITFFLRVPVAIAIKRMQHNRTGELEYFEKKREFLQQVVEQYEQAIQYVEKTQRVMVIDGTQSIELVAAIIQQEVELLEKIPR